VGSTPTLSALALQRYICLYEPEKRDLVAEWLDFPQHMPARAFRMAYGGGVAALLINKLRHDDGDGGSDFHGFPRRPKHDGAFLVLRDGDRAEDSLAQIHETVVGKVESKMRFHKLAELFQQTLWNVGGHGSGFHYRLKRVLVVEGEEFIEVMDQDETVACLDNAFNGREVRQYVFSVHGRIGGFFHESGDRIHDEGNLSFLRMRDDEVIV
jgi:hypothetical protein